MKFNRVLRFLLSVSAMQAVAMAQSGAGAFAESYLSNSVYSGPDVTDTEYDWYQLVNVFYGKYSYGSYYDYTSGYSDGLSYNQSYGSSEAYAVDGGSYDVNLETGGIYYAVTNHNPTSGEWAWLYLDGQTVAAALGDHDGYGWAEGGTEVINYTNGDFISEGSAAESGGAGLSWATVETYTDIAGTINSASFTTYSGSDTYAGGYGGGGGLNFTLLYGVYLAPGATEDMGVFEGTEHEAFEATPGPTALVPFGLGLLATLKRQKKR